MGEQSGVSIDKLTKAYVKIREKRAEISSKFKEEDENLVSQLDKIKKALLDYCKEHGVESVRTNAGLVYKSTRSRYWTSDWESMYKFVLQHEVPEFFDKRLNQTNVKQFLEENPDILPEGLNVDSEFTISVRRK
jgi:hypothetical protein